MFHPAPHLVCYPFRNPVQTITGLTSASPASSVFMWIQTTLLASRGSLAWNLPKNIWQNLSLTDDTYRYFWLNRSKNYSHSNPNTGHRIFRETTLKMTASCYRRNFPHPVCCTESYPGINSASQHLTWYCNVFIMLEINLSKNDYIFIIRFKRYYGLSLFPYLLISTWPHFGSIWFPFIIISARPHVGCIWYYFLILLTQPHFGSIFICVSARDVHTKFRVMSRYYSPGHPYFTPHTPIRSIHDQTLVHIGGGCCHRRQVVVFDRLFYSCVPE